ncbi:hypothetical protein [uncultured Jannaschia sp.]|uniref:hypothetical protein n=1 Tax=uncultured Jannaschia sp. TaxID=293347 RepID=UPI0026078569|nr:hypothetical protein [uncultured Jannaschia sp.]
MVSVIVLSFVVLGRRTTSDYEDARWPPARPRAALRQKAPRAASYTTTGGTTDTLRPRPFIRFEGGIVVAEISSTDLS